MIEFRTLGGIDLRSPEGVAIRSVLSQPKRLALLAYLVLERPGDRHRRDSLIGLFWPELEDERGRAILRKSLHYLRRSLGEDVLVGHGEEAVGVREDGLRCDALEFERAVEAGDGARALELYLGDLLDGLFVTGAPEFERWLDRRRWELRDRATETAWGLAERELREGNPVGAAHWGRRAFAIDAFGEAGLRRLLVLLDRLGDRAGAILAYEEFARRTRAEAVEPAPETLALIAKIRARDAPTPPEEAFGPANGALLGPAAGTSPHGSEPGGASTPSRGGGASSGEAAGPEVVAARRERPRRRPGLRIAALTGLLLAGFLAVRTLPGGSRDTLIGSGELGENVPVVLADFASPDESLARATTHAFRIDIARSPVLRLAEAERVAEALARMERDPEAALDANTARELARREGFPAVIAGEIHPAGKGWVFSAALLSAADGAVLASHRAAAADSGSILGAIDELSKALRRRIGESASQLRNEPPLEQVTTSNLRALESFSLALRALLAQGDISLGTSLLEEAVELDSTFASAQATLGVVLAVTSRQRTRAVEALARARRHRDRLPRRERLWHDAFYRWVVEGSLEDAARAYQSLIELEADRAPKSDLHDLNAEYAGLLLDLRADRRAEEIARRAVALDDLGRFGGHSTLAQALAYQGRAEEAEGTLVRYLERVPDQPRAWSLLGHLKASRGEHEAAAAIFGRVRGSAKGDPFFDASMAQFLAALAAVRGRIAEAADALEKSVAEGMEGDGGAAYLGRAAWSARLEVEVARRPDRALARVEAALARYPLRRIPPLDRPYVELAELFAMAGAVDRARRLLDEFETLPGPARFEREWTGRFPRGSLPAARGALALAEGRFADAVEAYRAADALKCRICALPGLARAFDLWGRADSALAVYERYLDTPEAHRLWADPFYLGPTYERLGQLHALRGDSARAAAHFGKFVELWADADRELQPRVRAARERLSDPGS